MLAIPTTPTPRVFQAILQQMICRHSGVLVPRADASPVLLDRTGQLNSFHDPDYLRRAAPQDGWEHDPSLPQVFPEPDDVLLRDIMADFGQLRSELDASEARTSELKGENSELKGEVSAGNDLLNTHAGCERTMSRQGQEIFRLNQALNRDPSAATRDSADGAAMDDDIPESIEDVVERARRKLPYLEIPADVVLRVKGLKSHEMADRYPAMLLNFLEFLNGYSAATHSGEFRGSLKEFAERHGADFDSLEPSKVKLDESDTIKRNKKHMRKRTFPISTAVDQSGLREMLQHYTLPGQGINCPQVRFYVDVHGPTGKVHIGGIVKRRDTPNSKTK